jgi:26S proteasome non-ATPase regulatory subunit 9
MATIYDLIDTVSRADVDLYQVRQKRQRLNMLQTDHVDLMSKIEKLLLSIHANARSDMLSAGHGPTTAASASASSNNRSRATKGDGHSGLDRDEKNQYRPLQKEKEKSEEKVTPAFALIDEVMEGSPAAASGMRMGDKVIAFGSVRFDNHRELTALVDVVRGNVNRGVEVRLLRGGDIVDVVLTPQTWSGQGEENRGDTHLCRVLQPSSPPLPSLSL